MHVSATPRLQNPRLSRRELLATSIACAGATTIGVSAAVGQALPASYGAAWREDIAVLFEELRNRHRDLFHHTPEGVLRAAVNQLRADCGELERWCILARIQMIVALAGDGHTFLFADSLYRPYPFEVAWFGDDIRVVRTSPEVSDLLGTRVVRLDGSSAVEICRRLDRVIPQAETPWYVLGQRPDRLKQSELIAALGIARSKDRIFVEAIGSRGERIRRVVEPLALADTPGAMSIELGPRAPEMPDAGFGWRRINGGRAVHLNFRSYDDLPRKAEVFFKDLRAAPPEALIIDLRENSGGNYTLPRDHIIAPLQQMPALNRRGRLFVLIGRKTFSAAMTNATDFRRETEALLVGEPAGARPNGYQELATFTLPHSALRVGCSTASYRFGAPGDRLVEPDITAAPRWDAFRSGSDPAIAAVLAQTAV